MSNATGRIIDYLIERSFGTKTIILVFGAVIIYSSSWVRQYRPWLGIGLFLAGILLEWVMLYLVYIQNSRVKDSIERTRREVEETQDEVEKTQEEIFHTKSEIEDIHERTFESFSHSKNSMNTLESRVEELEQKMGSRGHSRNNLERRVEDLESEFKSIKRGLR